MSTALQVPAASAPNPEAREHLFRAWDHLLTVAEILEVTEFQVVGRVNKTDPSQLLVTMTSGGQVVAEADITKMVIGFGDEDPPPAQPFPQGEATT